MVSAEAEDVDFDSIYAWFKVYLLIFTGHLVWVACTHSDCGRRYHLDFQLLDLTLASLYRSSMQGESFNLDKVYLSSLLS